MKDNKKQYWKGIEQLTNDPAFVKHADKEFSGDLPLGNEEGEGSSRRDFLKMMGFGIAAASLAACETPVRKAIPYVNKPVDVDPGIANYYASTYFNGGDYASVVVKTREGRPIKIEGNPDSKISQGGVTAQVDASVLSLYDDERLKKPQAKGKVIEWASMDKAIVSQLGSIAAQGGQIRMVSNTIISPSTKAIVEEFKAKYPTAAHITYDTISAYGIMKANEGSFGVKVVPSYDFSKANVIVSLGADFLGTWLSPIEFTKQYSKTRKLNKGKKNMSRHYQFESNLSLSGANADYRTAIKPSEEGAVIANLYNLIASKSGRTKVSAGKSIHPYINKAASDLLASKGKALVVSGSNDPAIQTLVNGINDMLGNYGTTIDLSLPLLTKQGDDAAMDSFIKEASSGSVKAVIFYNCNPVYNHPKGATLAKALAKVPLKISTSDRKDETAALVDYIAPDNHYLESWGDAEPKSGSYSFVQPAISPLFDTRQVQVSLMRWADRKDDYFEYLQQYWKKASGTSGIAFQGYWDKAVQTGVFELESSTSPSENTTAMDSLDVAIAPQETISTTVSNFQGDIMAAAASIAKSYKSGGSDYELALYHKIGLGDGTHANNPWLQEMPDPITKATWDNYVTISQKDAGTLGIKMFEGKSNMVKLTVGGTTLEEVPVLIQPGQAEGTIGLALGYGRSAAGKVATEAGGIDANPFIGTKNGGLYYAITKGLNVEVLSKEYQVAQTQTHQTYMGRENVIQESVLSEYKKNPKAGRYEPKISTWQAEDHKVDPSTLSLWKGHKYPNHHWGLAIDLNSCTGCSACTVACHTENNVPVVGREEVINRRDMHWMRIDRYYSSNAPVDDLRGLEVAAENPEVTFQPMMCQHCNNAPCETVCPVAATTHSTEGLNQMTYNRCIGTRYCANNCPYKVRRFNWFKYHDNKQFENTNTAMNSDLGKMVLNPDVTVRSRGVMEKCSFCVQRIQKGKLEAKKEGRRPTDADVNTACASACPADALIFGDMNNPESEISKFLNIKDIEGDYGIDKHVQEPRAYHVLEEIGVKPNVVYLTKIRNKEEEKKEA